MADHPTQRGKEDEMNTATRHLRVLAALLPLVPLLMAPTAVCHAQAADRVFLNGNIYAVDEAFTTASALAVRDGRFIYVGDDAGVQAHVGPTTLVFDLEGSTPERRTSERSLVSGPQWSGCSK
jgi:hypothetical protein